MDMMNFEFEDRAIRIVAGEDGAPLWVARDVAEALGYASLDSVNKLIGPVPEEWKDRKRIPTPGGEQNMAVLTEQGLYFFLGRSDKPAALPFQKWIAGDVLPAIRKTGSYHSAPPRPSLWDSNNPVVLDHLSAVLAHKARLLRELAAIDEILERGELPALATRNMPTSSLEPRVIAWVQEFVLPDATGCSLTTTKAVMEGVGVVASRSSEVSVGRILHGIGFERIRIREDGVRRYFYKREKVVA